MSNENRYPELRRQKRTLYSAYLRGFRRGADKSQLTLWFEGDDIQLQLTADLKSWDLATEIRLEEAISPIDPVPDVVGNKPSSCRPPFNAEYFLHLLLSKEEREIVIGDLLECYGQIRVRFGKRRADIWFYKQVIGSVYPLVRRALLRIGALVWLGRILRRLIS